MINGVLYSVFLDGSFIGVTEAEDLGWEIAQDYLNGYDTLYDDDVDRVETHKIDVNRWYMYDEYNCSDKLSDENIMCYGYHETINCVNIVNILSLQQEREEAKQRALQL